MCVRVIARQSSDILGDTVYTQLEDPTLEVAPTTLLLIYSFQFRNAFQPTGPSSRTVGS